MKRWFLLLMILALALAACQPLVMENAPPAQTDVANVATVDDALADPDATLPLDPAIRYGVLENGLTEAWPKPTIMRPLERWSSTAICSATRTGSCQGSTMTIVPSLTRSVLAAM